MKIKIQKFLQGKIKAHCSLQNEPYYYIIHCELDHWVHSLKFFDLLVSKVFKAQIITVD